MAVSTGPVIPKSSAAIRHPSSLVTFNSECCQASEYKLLFTFVFTIKKKNQMANNDDLNVQGLQSITLVATDKVIGCSFHF